eukprot:5866-Heterococcus_DN1.PRE.1
MSTEQEEAPKERESTKRTLQALRRRGSNALSGVFGLRQDLEEKTVSHLQQPPNPLLFVNVLRAGQKVVQDLDDQYGQQLIDSGLGSKANNIIQDLDRKGEHTPCVMKQYTAHCRILLHVRVRTATGRAALDPENIQDNIADALDDARENAEKTLAKLQGREEEVEQEVDENTKGLRKRLRRIGRRAKRRLG